MLQGRSSISFNEFDGYGEDAIRECESETKSQSLSSSKLQRLKHCISFVNLQFLDLRLPEEKSAQQKTPVLTSLSSQESLGRLSFSVAYDMENKCLTVCILTAQLSERLLPQMSLNSPQPRWCKAVIIDKKKKRKGPDTCVILKLEKPTGAPLEYSSRTCKNTLQPSYG